MRQIYNRIIPFIMIGIALVAFAFGIFLLAYLFFFGAIVGLALFIVSWLRSKFFPPKNLTPTKKSGRVIDSDDWNIKV